MPRPQENKRLSEPLAKALKEVETLRSALTNYEADKEALRATKARLAKVGRGANWTEAIWFAMVPLAADQSDTLSCAS